MKKLFLIFTVLFTSISPMAGFGDYSDCSLEATREAFRIWSFNFDTKVPEKYKQQIQDIINSPVTHDSSGTCTPGGQFKCTKGQIYKDCCPCAQFGAESQAEKQFRQDYIKQKCGDKPKVVQAQVEELSPEDEVTAYDEYDPSQDSQGAPYATQQNNSWNTNYNDSDETPASTPAPTPNKSASAMIAQDATRKAEKNKKNCTPAQRNKINATNCKISPDGKYSDIECKNGYTKNADGTKCEKSDTPDKKAKPELIKISGIVIDATSKDEQTIGGVRIKYDEGKKDKDGNQKYALHQTGNNGRFAIKIVPNSTITFTHKMYETVTKTYSSPTSQDEKILMPPTDATVNDRNLQELCEKDKKGTWIKTSGKCNCKDKTATFDETKGCVPPKNLQRGGNVIDEKGNPMPNVTIKYGNKKIQTDKDGRFDITAPKGTVVTLSAKGYEDIQITLDEDCPNCDIDMTPTEKSANNAKKKELCEKNGKGEWKPKLNKCNCKGKAFFDEDEGCVESTQEYIDAEQALNNLYEQFTTQLEQIKNTDTQ